MKMFNKILNYIFLALFLINLFIPLVKTYNDNFKDSTLELNGEYTYDDMFLKQDCFEGGFYFLGSVSRREIMENYDYYVYERDVKIFDDEVYDNFISFLKEGIYTPTKTLEAFFVTVISGYYNTLATFRGEYNAFHPRSDIFSEELNQYALKKEVFITAGDFVNIFGNVYLIAGVSSDTVYHKKRDVLTPNDCSETVVFKVNDELSEKFLASDDTYKNYSIYGTEQYLFNRFNSDWFLKEFLFIGLYFVNKPKQKEKTLLQKFLDLT